MINNRYEEYVSFSENLPFAIFKDLERSARIFSKEANWHENLEIQICEKGSGYVILDGKNVPFREGDTIVVNTNVIHYTGTREKLVYSCIILDQSFCKGAGIDPLELCFEESLRSEKIYGLIEEIKALHSDSKNVCRAARLRMLTLELLIELRENHTKEKRARHDSDSDARASHENVKNAIRYIRENYAQRITLEDIAGKLFVNKYVLSRQFKAATGQTVIEYLRSFRCSAAKLLIESGESVSSAALGCGFTNMSYFSKTFKHYFGCLPRNLKK